MSGENKEVPINLPDTLEDAERFQRLFVQPMVDAMGQRIQSELQPIVSGQRKLFASIAEQKNKDAAQDAAIADLKGKQAKALLGWGVYATVAASLIGVGLDWAKGKLGWKK
jgi:hypothetical protein